MKNIHWKKLTVIGMTVGMVLAVSGYAVSSDEGILEESVYEMTSAEVDELEMILEPDTEPDTESDIAPVENLLIEEEPFLLEMPAEDETETAELQDGEGQMEENTVLVEEGITEIENPKGDGSVTLDEDAYSIALTDGDWGSYSSDDGADWISWTFNDGVLTIRGSGAPNCVCEIHSYGYSNNRRFFNDFGGSETLEEVIIEPGLSQIGPWWFMNCVNLKTVTLPETVSIIGEETFWGCTSLPVVKIPSSAARIGAHAFDNCSSLAAVDLTEANSLTNIGVNAFQGCASLGSVVLPDSVTSLGSGAFKDCTGLHTAKLGNGLTSLNLVFQGCTGLKNVTLPKNLSEIPAYAFQGCTSLSQIKIPSSVTRIGNYAFENCTSLTEMNLTEAVSLESIGRAAFYECTKLESVILPDSVTQIEDHAFNSCTGLQIAEFGEGLSSIGYAAFYKTAIKSLAFHTALEKIGNNAFEDCLSLKEANIPADVTIGVEAFSGCTSLEELVLGNSITLEKDAFAQCMGLKTVQLDSGFDGIYRIPFAGNTNLESVTIGENYSGVYYITNEEFEGCSSLKELKLGKGLTHISYAAFKDCLKLSALDLPDELTAIGDSAFMNCTGIKELTVPETIETIGSDAFKDCSGITDLTFLASAAKFDNSAFSGCTGFVTATIDCPSLEQLPWGENLKSVELGDSVDCIGSRVFENCTALESIHGDCVSTIEDYAFKGCSSLCTETIISTSTVLGKGAFWGAIALKTAVLNAAVKTIPELCFSDCTGLQKITGSGVVTISKSAFANCNSLQECSFIEDEAISIGASAFTNCISLRDCTFIENASIIREDAFTGCTSLNRIVLGNGLAAIHEGAFTSCTGLTTADFSKCTNLEYLGAASFEGCTALQGKLDFSKSKINVLKGFEDCCKVKILDLPASANSAYLEGMTGLEEIYFRYKSGGGTLYVHWDKLIRGAVYFAKGNYFQKEYVRTSEDADEDGEPDWIRGRPEHVTAFLWAPETGEMDGSIKVRSAGLVFPDTEVEITATITSSSPDDIKFGSYNWIITGGEASVGATTLMSSTGSQSVYKTIVTFHQPETYTVIGKLGASRDSVTVKVSPVFVQLEESYETKAGAETAIIADVTTTLEDVSDILISWAVDGPGNAVFPETTGIHEKGDSYISPAAFSFTKPGEYTVTASYQNVSDTAVVKVAQPDIYLEDSEQIINKQVDLTATCDSETEIQLTDVEWEIENNNVTRKPIELTEAVSGPDGTKYTLTKTVKFLEIGKYTVRVSVGDKKFAATVIVKPDKIKIKEPERRDEDNRQRSVTARWEQTDGAAIYEVQWSQDPEDFSECDAESNKCARYVPHDDTIQTNINYESTDTLERGENYYIRVRAIGAEGNKDPDEKFAGEWSDVSEPIRAGYQILASEFWNFTNPSPVLLNYNDYQALFPKGAAFHFYCDASGQNSEEKVDLGKWITKSDGECLGMTITGVLAAGLRFPSDIYGVSSLSDIGSMEEALTSSLSHELNMYALQAINYIQLLATHKIEVNVYHPRSDYSSIIGIIENCQNGINDDGIELPLVLNVGDSESGKAHSVVPLFVEHGNTDEEAYKIRIYNPNSPLRDDAEDNYLYINNRKTSWKMCIDPRNPSKIWTGTIGDNSIEVIAYDLMDQFITVLENIASGEIGLPPGKLSDLHVSASQEINSHVSSESKVNLRSHDPVDVTVDYNDTSSDNNVYVYHSSDIGILKLDKIGPGSMIFSRGSYAVRLIHEGIGDISIDIETDNPGSVEISPECAATEKLLYYGDFDKDGNQEFSYLTVDIAAGETAKLSLCPDGSIEFSGVTAIAYVRDEGCMQGDSFVYDEDANESISCENTNSGQLYQISDAASVVILRSSVDQGETYTQVEAVNEKTNGEDYGQTISGLPAEESFFPDSDLRQVISATCDTDHDGILSPVELNAVTELDVGDRIITDFTGLAYISNLKAILCDMGSKTALLEVVNEASIPLLVIGRVFVDENHFPDANFRSFINSNLDIDHNGFLTESELEAVKEIDIHELQIRSLKGIEYFTHLEKLICWDNNLSSLDLTKNTCLTYIDCDKNHLTELDTSDCPSLTTLSCCENYLTSLDVGKNTSLVYFYCSGNNLKELNVSRNPNLQLLYCHDNQIEELNLDNNMEIRNSSFTCYNNALVCLDTKRFDYMCLYPNKRKVEVGPCNQIDLSTFPGFDITAVHNLKGGFIQGTVLTAIATSVTYIYDSNKDHDYNYSGYTVQLEISNYDETGGHRWSAWSTTRNATALSKGIQTRTCTCCGKKETHETEKLKATVKLNRKKVTLKKKGKKVRLKIKSMTRGDKVLKWKSSNKKVATVSRKGVVKARKKGKCTITLYMKSGAKAKCKIIVKK